MTNPSNPNQSLATPSPSPNQSAPVNFRSISPSAYAELDPSTKNEIVRARHLGMIRNSESIISEQLVAALTQDRPMPDGSIMPPAKHEDIVVVLMHRDDPITPPDVKDRLEQQNIEVAIWPADRAAFAEGMRNYPKFGFDESGKPIGSERPYKKVFNVLSQKIPDQCVYIAVFDSGMCTVIFVGFDPTNPNGVEYIQTDSSVKPPPAVSPLQQVEPKKPSAIEHDSQK